MALSQPVQLAWDRNLKSGIWAIEVYPAVTAKAHSMPQGFWSSLMKGGSSANPLTEDLLTDMGKVAALQETKTEIVKLRRFL